MRVSKAAALGLAWLAALIGPAGAQGRDEQDLSIRDAMAIQEALVWSGHYEGTIDGRIAGNTIKAIRAFQREIGNRPTGALTREETAALAARAARLRREVGYERYQEPATGIVIGLPLRLAPPIRKMPQGTRFASADGMLEIEVFRFPRDEGSLEELYRRVQTKSPERRVTYSRLGEGWFVVSGTNGRQKFYTRARLERAGVAAFAVVYDSTLSDTVEPIIVAMSSSFARPDVLALAVLDPEGEERDDGGDAPGLQGREEDRRPAPPDDPGRLDREDAGRDAEAGRDADDGQRDAAETGREADEGQGDAAEAGKDADEGQGDGDETADAPERPDAPDLPLGPRDGSPVAAGFAVSDEGHFLTSARAARCERISIGALGEAEIVAVDRDNELALLKVTANTRRIAVRLSDGRMRPGDGVTIAAPQIDAGAPSYVANGQILEDDGDAGRLRVAVPPRPGDGGAPLFDARGGVVGILLPMRAEAVAGRFDPGQAARSALGVEVLEGFLSTHGVTAEGGGRAGDPSEVSDRARRLTLPVFCMEDARRR